MTGEELIPSLQSLEGRLLFAVPKSESLLHPIYLVHTQLTVRRRGPPALRLA